MGQRGGRQDPKVSEHSNGKLQRRGGTSPSHQPRAGIFRRIPVIRALLRGGEWSRPDTLTAIGLTVAMVAIIAPILTPFFQSSPPSAGPDLKVDDVEIALTKNIDASATVPGIATPQREIETASAIDITLRNTGDEPALIVKAVFSFTQAIELASCTGGAGAGVSTAQYDVTVPSPRPVAYLHPISLHPFSLERDMRFIVNSNSIDRFRISIGPRKYSDVSWPWIYEFKLSLVEDNGQRLDLGSMSVLGFSYATATAERIAWDPLRGLTQTGISQLRTTQEPCVARASEELARAMARPGLHSPELQVFYHEIKRLTASAPP